MAFNITVLTNIGTNNSVVSWDAPFQQTTILDAINPNFPRAIQLSSNGLRIIKANNSIGINYAVLINAAVAVNPNLTWPPIIVNQPANMNVVHPNVANFNISATAELIINYQWQLSSDNGGNYSNLTNAGVYTNVTTNHLNISNSTGLTGNYYRCIAWEAAGTTNSNAAILTVT